MSRLTRRDGHAHEGDRGLTSVALYALYVALHAEVIAVVGREANSDLFILPSSEWGADVFRALAEADWPTMIRMAEEHYV